MKTEIFFRDLGNGFQIRELTHEELSEFTSAHFEEMFRNRLENPRVMNSEKSNADKVTNRRKADQRYQLRLGVFKDNQVVGWHFGHATDAETYYMQNSAILKAFRGNGLYSKLLAVVLEILKGEGFQVVTSTHHPNNAAVLIPKLKQGFIITSTQFHERFRFLVELRYIYDEARRKAFHQSLGLDI